MTLVIEIGDEVEGDEDDENYEDDECHLPKLSNVELCKGILILW